MGKNNIYFAWIKFQRRAISMQSYFDYDSNHITSCFKHKYLRIFDYVIKSIKTVRLLYKYKPEIIWLQLPPIFLLNLLLFYRKYVTKKIIIISDCHNGVFYGKWKKYFNPHLINKSDIVLVHNAVIQGIAVDMGLDKDKIFILEDKPAEKSVNLYLLKEENRSANQVLMPCGFSIDEPLEIVFEAARKIPETIFLISGPKERGISLFDYSKKPDNVHLVGYLTLKDYEILFMQSDIILGLTTEDHIQLSVANEAVGMEKPMVLSNTQLLCEMFNKGAVYVETLNADSIANGIKSALENLKYLQKEVKVLKKERNQQWENMAVDLNKKIEILIYKK